MLKLSFQFLLVMVVCADTSHSGVQLKDWQFAIWLGSFLLYPVLRFVFYHLFFLIYSFICSCSGSSLLCWLFSSCSKQGLLSSCGRRLLVTVDSLVAEHGLGVHGLQQSQRVGTLRSRGTGLVAPQHVGSSRTKDRTCVSFFGRQIFAIESPGSPFPSFLIYYIFEYAKYINLKRDIPRGVPSQYLSPAFIHPPPTSFLVVYVYAFCVSFCKTCMKMCVYFLILFYSFLT